MMEKNIDQDSAMEYRLVSGTALFWEGRGFLIEGPSGSGKSDLALRLIEAGALLVSDDIVEIRLESERLFLVYPGSAPASLQGWIEARGIGIVKVSTVFSPVTLALILRLTDPEKVERLPQTQFQTYLGIPVRVIELAPFEISSVAKVRLALTQDPGTIIPD